ncbi:dethiobiotin synthase [bacterium]|nr:dethiobiotin synthase [bacterium]
MSKNLFITGTGTDVGKTYISALLVKALKDKGKNALYYKAAVSGNERINDELIAGDSKFVCDLANININPNSLVSYIFEEAVSPHLAAQRTNTTICLDKIINDFNIISSKCEYLTVEGSGGILCPISYENDNIIWLEDIIKALNLSVLIVSNSKLGSINSVGLTVSYLKEKKINIKGIIINEYDKNSFMERDNIKMIEDLTQIPVLTAVERGQKELIIENLEDLYE